MNAREKRGGPGALRSRAGTSFVVALCFIMLSLGGIALLTTYLRSSVKSAERLPRIYDGKNIFNTATARAVSLLETSTAGIPSSGAQCTVSTAAPYAVLQFNTAGGGKWQVVVTTHSVWAGCRCAPDFSSSLCRS